MRKIYLYVAVIAAGMLLAGCGADAQENTAVEPIDSEVQAEQTIESVEAYGVVEATDAQSISVDFDARVNKIYVKAGEKISGGDRLVDFDISVLENAIASQEMEIEETAFDIESKNYSVETLALDLENESADLADLEDDLRSKEELYAKGAIAEDALDTARVLVDQKNRAVNKMQLNLKSTKAQVKGERQALENKLERLKDELERLKDKQLKANFVNGNQIVSKIDNGVVSEVTAKEGEYVNREISVMTIVDLDSRIVRADIAEEFIGRIYEGQLAEVTSQAVPDKTYRGKVVRIWGTSIKKGGETIVPIEIALDDMDDKLFINFNVDVKILLEEEAVENKPNGIDEESKNSASNDINESVN